MKKITILALILSVSFCAVPEARAAKKAPFWPTWVKPKVGMMTKGTARLVGRFCKYAGCAELAAKIGIRVDAYYTVKWQLEESDLPLDIRRRYLEGILNGGANPQQLSEDLSYMTKLTDQKAKIDKKIRKIQKDGFMFEPSWRREDRFRKIDALKSEKQGLQDDYARRATIVESYFKNLEKVKTEPGRDGLKKDLFTVNEDLSENYALHAEVLNDTGNEIAGDFVQLVNDEAIGAVISGGLEEHAEMSGALPQIQKRILPGSAELTKDFVTNMEGLAVQAGASKADVTLEVPYLKRLLGEFKDWAMEDPADKAARLERERMLEEGMKELERRSLGSLGSEEDMEREALTGLGSEVDITDMPAELLPPPELLQMPQEPRPILTPQQTLQIIQGYRDIWNWVNGVPEETASAPPRYERRDKGPKAGPLISKETAGAAEKPAKPAESEPGFVPDPKPLAPLDEQMGWLYDEMNRMRDEMNKISRSKDLDAKTKRKILGKMGIEEKRLSKAYQHLQRKTFLITGMMHGLDEKYKHLYGEIGLELLAIIKDPDTTLEERHKAIEAYIENIRAVVQEKIIEDHKKKYPDATELTENLKNPELSLEERTGSLKEYQEKLHALGAKVFSGGIMPTFDGGTAYAAIPTPAQVQSEGAKRQAQQKAAMATLQAIGNAAAAISNAQAASQSQARPAPAQSGHYHASGDR